ncbi:MAG TPA: hypothetical protein VFZ49_02125 [Pyrinomonadaceae bacterium]
MKNIHKFLIVIAILAIDGYAQKPSSDATPAPKPDVSKSEKLPSAREIVDKYVKAIGGKEALTKPRSRYETGTVELSPMGIQGKVELFVRSDNRSLTRVNIAGLGEVLDGFDGKTAWIVHPVFGTRVKAGKELKQAERNRLLDRAANFEDVFDSVSVRGTEKVGDRGTYVVVGSTVDLPDEIFYFDTESGLMLRRDSIIISPEGQQATSTFYEDFREVAGIKSAFKMRAKTPAFEIITILTEIKYDVAIEDSKFVQPK